jgi:uncharacterized protein YggE
MTRVSAAVASVLFAPLVVAQPVTGTVSAEAVEYVRAKPDFAKVYLKVETRNSDAKTSADEHEEAVKRAVEVIDRLKLKGVKVAAQNQQAARTETDQRLAAGFGQPREPRTLTQYLNSRTLLVTVADANPEHLEAAVAKVQQEAVRLGLSGDVTLRATLSAATGVERGSAPQVVYGRADGWDELAAPAVEKATKRAVKKAELLAVSAGLKPGEVVSVSDVGGTTPATTRPGFRAEEAADTEEQTTYVDGELVRKVRVRVVLTAGK